MSRPFTYTRTHPDRLKEGAPPIDNDTARGRRPYTFPSPPTRAGLSFEPPRRAGRRGGRRGCRRGGPASRLAFRSVGSGAHRVGAVRLDRSARLSVRTDKQPSRAPSTSRAGRRPLSSPSRAGSPFYLVAQLWDLEDGHSDNWYATFVHLLDANNRLYGHADYIRLKPNVGVQPGPLTAAGGSNIRLNDLTTTGAIGAAGCDRPVLLRAACRRLL